MALNATQQDTASRIYQRSVAYALQNGANQLEADAFARSNISIGWAESDLIPTARNPSGAYGVFQALVNGGRGAGHDPRNLLNADYNINISLPELWQGFRRAGGAAAFVQDPHSFVVQVSNIAQRPSQAEQQKAVAAGRYRQGLEAAQMVMNNSTHPVPMPELSLPSTGVAPAPMPQLNLPTSGPRPVPMPDFGQTQDPAKASVYGQLFSAAAAEKGKRYAGPVIGEPDAMRWGTPGWDCSSFVSSVYKQIGVNLTPFTDAAYDQTRAISANEARPGDIIFFKGSTAQPGVKYGNMGIYLGNGMMIDAAYDGGVAVRPVSGGSAQGREFEIRRAPGMDKQAAPQAAEVAVVLGEQVAQGPTAQGGANVTISGNVPGMPTAGAGSGVVDWNRMLQGEVDAMNRERGTLAGLQQQMAGASMEDAFAIRKQIEAVQASIDSRVRTIATLRQLAQGETVDPIALANLQRQVAADNNTVRQNEFTNAVTIATANQQAVQQMFANDVDLATLTEKMLRGNRDAVERYTTHQMGLGRMSLDAASAMMNAVEVFNAQQIQRAGIALNLAQFVSDENYRNATRLLPSTVKYQPGFEPNGAMAQVFQRFGLSPMVLETAQVKAEQFDPWLNWQRAAETSGFTPGTEAPAQQFAAGMAPLAAAYAQSQDAMVNPQNPMFLTRPTDITPGMVGMPSASPDLSPGRFGMPQTPPTLEQITVDWPSFFPRQQPGAAASGGGETTPAQQAAAGQQGLSSRFNELRNTGVLRQVPWIDQTTPEGDATYAFSPPGQALRPYGRTVGGTWGDGGGSAQAGGGPVSEVFDTLGNLIGQAPDAVRQGFDTVRNWVTGGSGTQTPAAVRTDPAAPPVPDAQAVTNVEQRNRQYAPDWLRLTEGLTTR